MTAAAKPCPTAQRISKGAIYAAVASVSVVVMAVAGVLLDNKGEATFIEAARAFAAFAALAVAAPLALFRLGGAFRYAGYVFPVALFCFFKFVGFVSFAEFIGLNGDRAFVTAFGFAALVTAAAMQSFRRREDRLASFVAVVTGAAAIASAAALAPAALKPQPPFDPVVRDLTAPAPTKVSDRSTLPDIIYIVPDRHGAGPAFDAEFGADSGAFAQRLEERGFYVARNARSNYAKTFQSLASTLNMTYLDALVGVMGPDETNRQPIFEMMEDSAVQKTLRSIGYEFIHLGSWWEPTSRNKNADVNYDGRGDTWSALSEFERALLRTTPVAAAATNGGFVARNECERLKAQLDYLKTARSLSDGPVFIFAHMTMPHDPITMNRLGECIDHIYYPGSGISYRDYTAAFRDYVSFVDDELIKIFDANRKLDRKRDFVFVVQADEGPYPKRLHEHGEMDMFEFTEDEIRLKFGIINALYWNADRYGSPTLTQTPINNWRIILSAIAGADLPLVADERSIQFRDESRVYQTRDVTTALLGSLKTSSPQTSSSGGGD